MSKSFLFLVPVSILAVAHAAHTDVRTSSSTTRSIPSECSDPPWDSCSFYSVCLEDRYHCGSEGYPLGYGQKYCQKFSDERAKLSQQGQIWMLDTMHCLQTALVPDALVPSTAIDADSCKKLEDKAFASHAGCYVNSGVCRLPVTDWLAIVEIVKLQTLFQSWDAFEATLDAVEGCLSFKEWIGTLESFKKQAAS